MSFSYSAASVDNDYNINPDSSTQNLISKRKMNSGDKRNKTQRRPVAPDIDKVKSVVQSVHNNTSSQNINEGFSSYNENDDDDDNNLGDFKPLLAPPISASQEHIKTASENKYAPLMNNSNSNLKIDPNGTMGTYNVDETADRHNLDKNFMSEQEQKQYYRNLMGNYPPSNTTAISSIPSSGNSGNSVGTASTTFLNSDNTNDPTLTKLNYLIHLMEEQQSIKTDSVTEDIILYSFLGVFVIFVVDSFVRVGKYVR